MLRTRTGVSRRCAAGIVVALAAGLCTAAAAGPAAAASAGGHHPAAARPAAGAAARSLLGPAAALAQARKTGRPVTVSALTTTTATTTAGPGGKFTYRESLTPVRKLVNGQWESLSPDLHAAAGGRLTPQAATADVSLSGGGSSTPLAVLGGYGRTLSLSWPGTLPAPTVSGATATYANVLPGVNLAVTVGDQGSVSDVLIVSTAAAAANPALTSLEFTASAPGMTLSADQDDNIDAQITPDGAPEFVLPAPAMWDSAAPPAGSPTASLGTSTVISPSGMPAYSTASGPGSYAHTYAVTQKVSGSAITLTPPATALTAGSTVYPLYIDPVVYSNPAPDQQGSAWTQIDSGLPSSAGNWDEHQGANDTPPFLQVGYCDPSAPGFVCGSPAIGVTRTMVRFPLPSLPSSTQIYKANLTLTDAWSATCSPEPLQLWTTMAINNSTDWSNSGSWSGYTDLEEETFGGYGYSSGCPPSSGDVSFGYDSNNTSGVSVTAGSASSLGTQLATAIDRGSANQTFGLKAGSESTWEQWRQFYNWVYVSHQLQSPMTLSFQYYYPPAPTNITFNPGGKCQKSSPGSSIGDDSVIITNNQEDSDGDSGLTTTYEIYNAAGHRELGPATTNASAAGVTTIANIPGATIQGWQPNGNTTTYAYYLTAYTTDSNGESTNTVTCYFSYDPTGPAQPTVSGVPSPVQIGQSVSGVTITQPAGCAAAQGGCPAYYEWQIGSLLPQKITSAGATTTIPPFTIPITGDFQFTVTGFNAAGNPSAASTTQVNSTPPASSAPSQYYASGSYPDLLTTSTGTDASLWLSRGTANGALAPPVDIGSLGNGANSDDDSPSDWNGAMILQGHFANTTGYQDVLAYYPAGYKEDGTVVAGTVGEGIIVAGDGTAGTLPPVSGSQETIQSGALCDSGIQESCADAPTDLVAAGDASQLATGYTDLIGIWGDSGTNGYELDEFSAYGPGGYFLTDGALSGGPSTRLISPDGTDDWQDYSLATAQLPDTANEQGDPANIALFALNNDTGALYESVNPDCAPPTSDCADGATASPEVLTGMPGTWTRLTVPSSWSTAPPKLVSADVNNNGTGLSTAGGGQTELWTQSGTTLTAYSASSSTLTAEASGGTLAYPTDDWPLTGGGTTPDQPVDTITGIPATTSAAGSYQWSPDDTFETVFDTSGLGSGAYITPPASLVSTSATDETISLWFNTSYSAGGILASLQSAAVSSTATSVANYDPILYIGADGLLRAEWWTGTNSPITSLHAVNDGQWHNAVLTTTGTGSSTIQTLYIDGVRQGTLTGALDLAAATSGSNTNLAFADGFIGGRWPSEPDYNSSGGPGDPGFYYHGEIANITLTQKPS